MRPTAGQASLLKGEVKKNEERVAEYLRKIEEYWFIENLTKLEILEWQYFTHILTIVKL